MMPLLSQHVGARGESLNFIARKADEFWSRAQSANDGIDRGEVFLVRRAGHTRAGIGITDELTARLIARNESRNDFCICRHRVLITHGESKRAMSGARCGLVYLSTLVRSSLFAFDTFGL